MPRVVCTSLNAEQGPHHEILESHDFSCEVISRDIDLSDPKRLIDAIAGCVAIIAGSEPYPREVIKSNPNLRVIARTGVGFDAIDLKACDDHQVVVATTPGVNHHSVAEHALAMLMTLGRGLPEQDHRVRTNDWERIAWPRIMGQTIGIVGLGRIGMALAWRAAGLGMKVLAYEPFPHRDSVQQHRIEVVGLDELLSRSDVVSLHCPMAPETHHMINADSIAKMKDSAVLINTSRGKLVDETALYDALSNGRLRAAGLDVFETEPLPTDSPLIGLKNVIFSGHVAGLDNESHEDTFIMCAGIITGLQKGEWPGHCIQNLNGVRDWTWERP
jgi:D-3-phosphoglycerate dehydrogenase